ncbi:MAG TPA: hypothetical protein VMA71_06600 [Alloacidobacterium sp.]|nr:hypothetical protein [Alloacidobacterium sp.]
MKTVDRVFGWLLVVSTLLHCIGCLVAFRHTNPDMLLWTEGAGMGGFLLAAVNLLRVNRPEDRGLAWVSAAGCVAWVVLAISFGLRIGNLFDPRPLVHSLVTLTLLGFSLRTALGKAAVAGVPATSGGVDARAISN